MPRTPQVERHFAIAVLLAVLALAEPAAAEPPRKPFWLALAKECAVPAGESAFGLVTEALSVLGSPDTEWPTAWW
jgi:hypothetical protein